MDNPRARCILPDTGQTLQNPTDPNSAGSHERARVGYSRRPVPARILAYYDADVRGGIYESRDEALRGLIESWRYHKDPSRRCASS